MSTRVSFLLVDRNLNGLFASEGVPAFSNPDIDTHVLTPEVSQDVCKLPELAGDVVVLLDADAIPADDIVDVARTLKSEFTDPDRAVVLGRPRPHPELVVDPVTRALTDGGWRGFERIVNPDRVSWSRFHTHCLWVTRERFERARDAFETYVFGVPASPARLAAALALQVPDGLYYRPRLSVHVANRTDLEAYLDDRRSDARTAALLAWNHGLVDAFGTPSSHDIRRLNADAIAHDCERATLAARELAHVDLGRLADDAAAPILGVAERVLRDAVTAAIRLGQIDALGRVDIEPRVTSSAKSARLNPPKMALDLASMEPPDSPAAPSADERVSETIVDAFAPAAAPEDEAGLTLDDVQPEVSIVIVSRQRNAALMACLASVSRHTPEPHEVILLENVPEDIPDYESTYTIPSVDLQVSISDRAGYAETIGVVLPECRGKHVVLLSSEACVSPGWLTALVGKVEPGIGAVVPVSDGTLGIQHVGRFLGSPFERRDLETVPVVLARRPGAHIESTRCLQPLCVLVPGAHRNIIERIDRTIYSAFVCHLELAWRLAHAGLEMIVATDAYVSRGGGVPATLHGAATTTLTHDMARLYANLASAYGGKVAPSEAIWGVSWTGFDEYGPQGTGRPSLSVVIPVRNQLACTEACIDSLRRGSVNDFEIVVFDNGSSDGTYEFLNARADVRVLRSQSNLGFAPAVNRAVAASTGRLVLVLNNDVVVPHRMIERMLGVMAAHSEMAVVGPVSNECVLSQRVDAEYDSEDGLNRFADHRWDAFGDRVRSEATLFGFAMLIRREVIDTVGGFDEQFEIGNFEDNDFSLRATMAGFQIGIADGVFLHHLGAQTMAAEGIDYSEALHRNRHRFMSKWSEGATEPTVGEAAVATDELVRPRTPAPPIIRTAEPFARAKGVAPASTTARPELPPTASEPSIHDPLSPPRTGGARGSSGSTTGRDPQLVDPPRVGRLATRRPTTDIKPSADSLYLLGNDRLESGQYAEAAELFEWALELSPRMVLAHMGLGLALARSGRPEEAVAPLETTIRMRPNFAEALNNLGVVYYLLGRHDDAIRALARAITIAPENAEARNNLDEVRLRAGNR